MVRKFLHLLDLGDSDIKEEAELLRLREEVVRSIRSNRQLEADLNLMDLKIGLLVRNRATLQVTGGADPADETPAVLSPLSPDLASLLPISKQEVVSHCKKLTKKNKEQLSDMMDVEKSKGLKALSRDKRRRLEAYQHLFYLLQVSLAPPPPPEFHPFHPNAAPPLASVHCVCVCQTQPLYLAQLIFLMPQSSSTSFMEMLVFSLFNYGADRREAFLLLQLFTAALRYEIR